MKTTEDFTKERVTERQSVNLINLGCARNLVDSQAILGQIKKRGHRIVEEGKSDIAIVNTCAFIEDAKKESIDTILDLVEKKKQGQIKKIIVAGCLAQRYGKDLIKEIKEIDAVIGAQQLDRDNLPEQLTLTPKHYAYVKISESCYNQCRFCIIPKIKGKFVSRTMESVLKEVEGLDRQGVKEINIIGQDITAYGMDIYRKKSLAGLLKKIAAVTKNIEWIRLLYTFPAHVTDELIETIAGEEKICNYIDMPLQHISDNLLLSMNRNITKQKIIELIDKIRTQIPEAAIRTTFILGLPGETEENFEELLDFVRETKFEKAGAFIYSHEEGTAAFDMPDQVKLEIKRKRLNRLMSVQQKISRKQQAQYIQRILRVLIEEKSTNDKNIYLGRSEFDAPEVDGVVFVKTKNVLNAGDMVNVRIRDAYEYDLSGEQL